MSKSEQRIDDKEEAQSQSAAVGQAIQQAMQEADNREEFIEQLQDIGISGDEWDVVEDKFGPELAGIYAIANESRQDYRRHSWLTENKREREKAAHNAGRLCKGPILELARGTHQNPSDYPDLGLSEAERRKIREVYDAKKALHSLGKGAEGLSAVADVTAVTKHQRETPAEDNDDSGGFLSRIFG